MGCLSNVARQPSPFHRLRHIYPDPSTTSIPCQNQSISSISCPLFSLGLNPNFFFNVHCQTKRSFLTVTHTPGPVLHFCAVFFMFPKERQNRYRRPATSGWGLSSAFMVGLLVTSLIFASLAKRPLVVGEASFISLEAPFIDDIAPVAQKTAWLGAFYMCIPSGVTVGYVYGGMQVRSYFEEAIGSQSVLSSSPCGKWEFS